MYTRPTVVISTSNKGLAIRTIYTTNIIPKYSLASEVEAALIRNVLEVFGRVAERQGHQARCRLFDEHTRERHGYLSFLV